MGLLDFLMMSKETKTKAFIGNLLHEYGESATELRAIVTAIRKSVSEDGEEVGVTMEMVDRGIEFLNEEINRSYEEIEMLMAEGKTREEVIAEVGTSKKVEYDWDYILRGQK